MTWRIRRFVRCASPLLIVAALVLLAIELLLNGVPHSLTPLGIASLCCSLPALALQELEWHL